jgi:hypothetical protein
MQEKTKQCEIVYVKERQASGWKWRVVSGSGPARSSEQVYGLFYDCVLAARASGYDPADVLPSKEKSRLK